MEDSGGFREVPAAQIQKGLLRPGSGRHTPVRRLFHHLVHALEPPPGPLQAGLAVALQSQSSGLFLEVYLNLVGDVAL